MFDDLDFDRPATLRWGDPVVSGPSGIESSLDGSLRQALRYYAQLPGEEQAGATVTVAPVPGDWSMVVYEGRELKRMARRASGRVIGFLDAAVRLRRSAGAGAARLEWPDGDTRLRNVG